MYDLAGLLKNISTFSQWSINNPTILRNESRIYSLLSRSKNRRDRNRLHAMQIWNCVHRMSSRFNILLKILILSHQTSLNTFFSWGKTTVFVKEKHCAIYLMFVVGCKTVIFHPIYRNNQLTWWLLISNIISNYITDFSTVGNFH